MKNFILLLTLLTTLSTLSAQELKTISAKEVVAWDISDARQNDFKQLQEMLRDPKRKLSTEEHKYLDSMLRLGVEPEQYSFFSTDELGCSWYEGVSEDTAYCSSHLADYKGIKYSAKNIHDFDASTAWVEGKRGYGIGEKITVVLTAFIPVSITQIMIFNGYMKSEKLWKANGRVKTLKLYVNDKPYALLQLNDVIGEQIFNVDTLNFGKDPIQLTFEVVDAYKGTKYSDVAISEINFDGLGVHCFAKGTVVSMADGSEKPIENIAKGDEVLTYNFELDKTEVAIVEATAQAQHHNLVQLDFGIKKIKVTDDHPFYVVGKGWCTINGHANSVTSYLGKIQQLEVGDYIKTTDGKSVKLGAIEQQQICEPTFTITKLSNGNSFYANGLLVAVE